MTLKNLSPAPSFGDAGPRWVRAYVRDQNGEADRLLRFPLSSIAHIVDIDDMTSGITLSDGTAIAVALSGDALQARLSAVPSIKSREDPLDLRAVTGAAVTATLPLLSASFNREVPKEEPQGIRDVPLKIAMFVRKGGTQNFKMFICLDSDIDWGNIIHEESGGQNGPLTKVPLMPHKQAEAPFKESDGRILYLDIRRPQLMELYHLAKMRGDAELDLRELTRRKDPDAGKKPRVAR